MPTPSGKGQVYNSNFEYPLNNKLERDFQISKHHLISQREN